MFELENDGILVPKFGVLFKIVVEPGNNDSVVLLDFTVYFGVVRCSEDVFNSQDLADMLEGPSRELLPIVAQGSLRRVNFHDRMSQECFFHRLGCDRSEQNSTGKFRKPV